MSPCPPRGSLEQMLAGSLPEDPVAQITSHIEDCLHCQQALDDLTRFGDGGDKVPPPLDEDFIGRVLAALPVDPILATTPNVVPGQALSQKESKRVESWPEVP